VSGGFVESSRDGLRVVFISIAKASCQALAVLFFFSSRIFLAFPAEHCKRRANSGAEFNGSGRNSGEKRGALRSALQQI
jgi:hypothetical protein